MAWGRIRRKGKQRFLKQVTTIKKAKEPERQDVCKVEKGKC